MSSARIVACGFRSLARYKLRTVFIMIGNLVGVAALTLVVSVGSAARGKLVATVGQLFGSSSLVISAGGGFFLGGPRDAARLTLDDIKGVVQEVPGIELWDPMLVSPGTIVRQGDRNTAVRLLGQSERSERAWNRSASAGRFIDGADVSTSARVAVIGETVAATLFGDGDAIDRDIRIGAAPFRVVGILESFGTDIHGIDRDNEIVIPHTTAMRRVLNVDSIRAAKLVVSETSDPEAVGQAVTRVLRQRHGLGEDRPDDFTIHTSVAVRQMVGRIERIVSLYLPLVTATLLLASIAVAASLMLSSVNARKSEIGLRRAVGARPEDIRLQLLVETASTTLLGGIAGLLVGGVGTVLIAQRVAFAVEVGPGVVVLGLALSLATGLLAGMVPARRAALMSPAEALRQ